MTPAGEPSLLARLLGAMGSGAVHCPASLAQELDVSEAMVERMIQDLVRLGYLRSARPGGAGACGACPQNGSCGASRSGPRAWMLTDRGRRAGA
ncbi:MAG: hypothetical protein WC713_02200 [Candidatus Methylomirabilota bacterium]